MYPGVMRLIPFFTSLSDETKALPGLPKRFNPESLPVEPLGAPVHPA